MNTLPQSYFRWASAAVLLAVLPVFASADTKENWNRHCARCHGADGAGDTKAGKKLNVKDYTKAEFQAKFTDAEALKAITDGIKEGEKEKMGSYKEKLTDQERSDLVGFIRTLKK